MSGVVLSALRQSKTQGSSAHSDHYLQKGRGLTRVLGVAGLPNGGKRGPKLRSAGESLLQKSARESSKVAEIDILARIKRKIISQGAVS